MSALGLAELQKLINLPNLATAIRKLTVAASANRGSDCWIHASLPQRVLLTHGIESRIVVGYGAWRVGSGDGDVIVHAPQRGTVVAPDMVPYHAWLEIGGESNPKRLILDFTTYQLRAKAAALDAMDGQVTTVDWCPDYIATTASKVSSLTAVRKESVGMFFYQRDMQVEREVRRVAPAVDPEDEGAFHLLYKNPGIVVMGPNDV